MPVECREDVPGTARKSVGLGGGRAFGFPGGRTAVNCSPFYNRPPRRFERPSPVLRPGHEQRFDLCGQDKIALGQAIHLVRPEREPNPPPRQIDIRVVRMRFRNRTHEIGKLQRLPEIGKAEFFVQMMLANHQPVMTEFRGQGLQRRAG